MESDSANRRISHIVGHIQPVVQEQPIQPLPANANAESMLFIYYIALLLLHYFFFFYSLRINLHVILSEIKLFNYYKQ